MSKALGKGNLMLVSIYPPMHGVNWDEFHVHLWQDNEFLPEHMIRFWLLCKKKRTIHIDEELAAPAVFSIEDDKLNSKLLSPQCCSQLNTCNVYTYVKSVNHNDSTSTDAIKEKMYGAK